MRDIAPKGGHLGSLCSCSLESTISNNRREVEANSIVGYDGVRWVVFRKLLFLLCFCFFFQMYQKKIDWTCFATLFSFPSLVFIWVNLLFPPNKKKNSFQRISSYLPKLGFHALICYFWTKVTIPYSLVMAKDGSRKIHR